jgi:putative Mg2+ transporter-C (MgtC) family protein
VTGFEDFAVKIGMAALLAGAVGAEREWVGKSAGLRTHMLIAIGASLLSSISHGATPNGMASWDGGRIAAQIVSGVGFLGAGTILQARGAVHGLTTAAGLWVAAAIGIAVGSGFIAEASLATGLILGVLVILRPIEDRLIRRRHATIVTHLDSGQKMADLARFLDDEGLETNNVSIERGAQGQVVTVTFRGDREQARQVCERANLEGFDTAQEPAPLGPSLNDPTARKRRLI